jgi:hypothetical protein
MLLVVAFASGMGAAPATSASEASPAPDAVVQPGWSPAPASEGPSTDALPDDPVESADLADPLPQAETVTLRPRPKPGRFSMDLYEPGDFVHQQTIYWCVAASVQTMINIIEDDAPDRTKRFQRRLHLTARSLDPGHAAYWQQLADGSPLKRGLHGLGLVHWAGMLDASGHGPYQIDRASSRKQAIRRAARAIRTTGKPVGLVVWKGAHAWVMSGFRATADPAYTNEFTVTEVYIQDPWYPDVSAIWGASRPPDSVVPVAALDDDYLPYDRPGRVHPKRDGRYILILPALPAGTVVG